jgi:hypothetical protein
MENSDNNNIFFLIEESNTSSDGTSTGNNIDIDNIINNLLNYEGDEEDDEYHDEDQYQDQDQDEFKKIDKLSLKYYIKKHSYNGEDEMYYDEYTIKELMKICQYYDIAKNIKSSKCKKQDIVSTIVFFEGQLSNREIVNKRHAMWAYMTEIYADPKMRSYILWN